MHIHTYVRIIYIHMCLRMYMYHLFLPTFTCALHIFSHTAFTSLINLTINLIFYFIFSSCDRSRQFVFSYSINLFASIVTGKSLQINIKNTKSFFFLCVCSLNVLNSNYMKGKNHNNYIELAGRQRERLHLTASTCIL